MPWVSNGGGSGTDNRAAGGGGGYTAIPQPPTGPQAGFKPVENNGQFGATSIVFNNGTGVFFSVVNPGRSSNS